MVNYDSFSATFAESRKNMRWPEIEYLIELLKNSEKNTHTILDVGCGSGRFFGELKKANIDPEYLGIDSSSGMIDEAKKAYPEARFKVLDMLNLDMLDTRYDAIFLLASFHHLESESERLAVLQKLKSLLADGGIIYMTNWNLLSDENMQRY